MTAIPEGMAEHPADFLSGGGTLGAMLRAQDWSGTALGVPADWPQSLKTAIRIMLTSRQPFWIGWGPELLFFYNDAYRAIIGGKHPWALGRPASEVWAEIWDEIGPMLATAMSGDEGTYVEEQLLIMERNFYPEETYYTFSYSPIPDDDGRPGGIICANSDDTKRVIGERQLGLLRVLAAETAHARSWREVGEKATVALASDLRDLPYAIIYIEEPETDTLLLAGTSGIAPGHPAAPVALGPKTSSECPLRRALADRELVFVSNIGTQFAAPLPSGDWHRPPNEAVVLPILPGGSGAQRRGVLVVGLSPFRLFDSGYRDFLGLIAGQIAAALANADAYEQERRRADSLAELDRAKTVFFSNVSHEFRTPLTLMLGPLEDALGSGRLSDEQRDDIELAHRNGMRLLKLVNALLDFSRIEAGRATASFEPVDLCALTADLASSFRAATERAGLAFIVDGPADLPPVHVDRDMWEKIVLNLLSNAFKFTFEGSITVTVDQHDGCARLVVRDTGTGIPSAELPRLFERFHRVEGAAGRSFEGSGIGLALVKELVELHGGTIGVESEVGAGTAFTVALPLGAAHLPPAQVRTAAGRGTTAIKAQAFVEEALRWLPQASGGAETLEGGVELRGGKPAAGHGRPYILLADDNADMRDYICRLLVPANRCEAVPDGQAALEAARRERPDLILTDVMMPRLDGFGLIKAVREDASLRDVPIIVLSARAGEEASVEGIAAGADDYLVKPLSARELIARVDGTLALARMRRERDAALEAEARRLEEKVSERTAELEQANERLQAQALERERVEEVLRQSQKMEAVGKLTGGIAHDFNNLLQVIGGNLQLLANDVAGSERAERRLGNAMAGVARGSKLASQLLAFGRRQPLAPKVVNLGRFMRGLDDLLRRALGGGVEIETVASGGLWNTLIDPNQAENAILNLAINARDAMNGHGRLTLEAGNADLTDDYALRHADVVAGQYVMLAVTDTGCGMSEDVRDRAFEPFFTTKQDGQGTGLGLSMVYGFVKQSGGHVKIYSEPSQGTTVRLYLPRAHGAEDAMPEIEAIPVAGGTETILVVEDDEGVRETVVELLSELGYRVLRAKDAQSALAIVESGVTIHLLFTDVVMPGPLRSPELARKARGRLPGLAVLFTSGYTENAIVHSGRLDPGIELLSKPYPREALARKIRQLLRDRSEALRQTKPTTEKPM